MMLDRGTHQWLYSDWTKSYFNDVDENENVPWPLWKYHRKQFSRVYPRGSRIDSSNYDPITMWNHGVQLCALNYQTPGNVLDSNSMM